ncbi:MAG: alcohol dehydrogenase catalytic domain-containing protein [Candidatus Micrarchaeota archaeon]|nr:alcohol dehydrogenase catalytic domain-containing protein [Candidatus Micrarchaeota archaeon]
MMSQAAVLERPQTITIAEYRKSVPDGSMLLKVGGAGVCGTDTHNFNRQIPNGPYPYIMGHEVSGTIEAIGRSCGVNSYERLEVGDRVAVTPMIGCGECYYCKKFPHIVNYCQNRRAIGTFYTAKNPPHLYGGFAESIIIPPGFWVHKLPDSVPLDIGALVEPMAVAIHALARIAGTGAPYGQMNVGIGTSIVVQGSGPIGLLVAICAKFSGARVTVLDKVQERLELAKELGINETLNVSGMDDDTLIARIKGLHDGGGPDAVIEATGELDAVQVGVMLPRRGGKYIELGHAVDGGEIRIRPDYICRNYLEIIGSVLAPAHEYPKALHILSNADIPFRKMITGKFRLEDTEKAILNATARRGMKSMVLPNGDCDI